LIWLHITANCDAYCSTSSISSDPISRSETGIFQPGAHSVLWCGSSERTNYSRNAWTSKRSQFEFPRRYAILNGLPNQIY
jgi:hypothetical protein